MTTSGIREERRWIARWTSSMMNDTLHRMWRLITLQLRQESRTSFMWITSTSSLRFNLVNKCNRFVSSKVFLKCEDLFIDLSSYYAIPRVFWSPLCRNSNDFFDSKDVYDADEHIIQHSTFALDRHLPVLINLDTWFRFIIKKVDSMQSSYFWSKMSFYTIWTANCSINLYFDVPKISQKRLHQALASFGDPLDINVYANYTILLNEVLTMYDEFVWALRDDVWQIETILLEANSTRSSSSKYL